MLLTARHFWWPRINEAIQKKWGRCILCKMSGTNIKLKLPSTEKNQLPPLKKPNEEMQLDFIDRVTKQKQRFFILILMDRISKWPAASVCKTTEWQTAVGVFERYLNLHGIPKIIRTDRSTSFTGRMFRDLCRRKSPDKAYIRPSAIQTPFGLFERNVRTLQELLLTNKKTSEKFSRALDMAQNVMRKTPHIRLKSSAFELHYGREPNSKISDLLIIDALENVTKLLF